MATNYKAIAKEIIEIVGGAENIISAAHCATRLRLIVKDKELIDDKKIEAIDIVKGCFFTAGQYQIILGTGIVNKVYEEVMKLGISGTSKNEQAATAAQNAVWNKEAVGKDERLDDGSTDIDSLDAFEYTIERDMKYLIEEVEDV